MALLGIRSERQREWEKEKRIMEGKEVAGREKYHKAMKLFKIFMQLKMIL